MKEGYYYLKTEGEEPTLVHGYHCTDMGGKFGFGFNTHDGGGFLIAEDLADGTEAVPVTVTE